MKISDVECLILDHQFPWVRVNTDWELQEKALGIELDGKVVNRAAQL